MKRSVGGGIIESELSKGTRLPRIRKRSVINPTNYYLRLITELLTGNVFFRLILHSHQFRKSLVSSSIRVGQNFYKKVTGLNQGTGCSLIYGNLPARAETHSNIGDIEISELQNQAGLSVVVYLAGRWCPDDCTMILRELSRSSSEWKKPYQSCRNFTKLNLCWCFFFITGMLDAFQS